MGLVKSKMKEGGHIPINIGELPAYVLGIHELNCSKTLSNLVFFPNITMLNVWETIK